MAGGGTPVRDSLSDQLKLLIDYASSTINYYGYASPGTATSEARWRIKRETLDASGRITKIEFAKVAATGYATDDYVHIWDNRASLSYA